MKSKFLFAALLACLSILACRKVNLVDPERIANTWRLDKYLVNGTDITSSLLIRDFTEIIEDYDFYGYSYWCIDSNQDTIAEHGSTYTLKAGGDSIYFYWSYTIPLTVDDTIRGTRKSKIVNISDEIFVYEFEHNGRLHEFRMVPIEK